MVSVVSPQIMLANEKSMPSHLCYEEDGDDMDDQRPSSIGRDKRGINAEVEAATGGTVEDSLIAGLEAVQLFDDVAGVTSQPETGSDDAKRPSSGSGLKNGYVKTGFEELHTTQCTLTDQPDVTSLVPPSVTQATKDNEGTEIGVQGLKNGSLQVEIEALQSIRVLAEQPGVVSLLPVTLATDDNEGTADVVDEQRQSDAKAEIDRENQSDDIVELLDSVTLDDKDIREQITQQPLENDGYQTQSKSDLLRRGPVNGERATSDGGQPQKRIRFSPPGADGAPVIATQFSRIPPSQHLSPAPGCFLNPPLPAFTLPVCPPFSEAVTSYQSRQQKRQQQWIQSSSAPPSCRFASESYHPDQTNGYPYFSPQNECLLQANLAAPNCFYATTHLPSIQYNFPATSSTIGITPELPVLSAEDLKDLDDADDVAQLLVHRNEDFDWCISAEDHRPQVANTYQRPVDTHDSYTVAQHCFDVSPYMMSSAPAAAVPMTSPMLPNSVTNVVPWLDVAQQPVDSPPLQRHMVDVSTALSRQHRMSIQSSPSASDISLNDVAYDQPPSVAAASSCHSDNSDVASIATVRTPADWSSTSSSGGSPIRSVTFTDEPSPIDSAIYNLFWENESNLPTTNEVTFPYNAVPSSSPATSISVSTENQLTAQKRASQLNRSDLLLQNDDGDSYVYVS